MRKSELTEDQIAKMVIRKKDILSEILIGAVPGFSGIPREKLIRMLPGDGDIADMRETVLDAPEEKKVILDTCFDIPAPEGGSGKVIVAIDLQGYSQTVEEREARIMMYAAKLMASQMPPGGNRKYSDLRRVHCVWVEVHPPTEDYNSIYLGKMSYSSIHGGVDNPADGFPLLSITRIGLGQDSSTSTGNRLLDILNTLWAGEIKIADRIEKLEEKYKISVSNTVVRGLRSMGSLSEDFTRYGMSLGRKMSEEELKKSAEALKKSEEARQELDVKCQVLEGEKQALEVENGELKGKILEMEDKTQKIQA